MNFLRPFERKNRVWKLILTAKPLELPAPEDMTAQSVGGVGQEVGQRWTGQKLQKEMAKERQRRGQDGAKMGPRWGQDGPRWRQGGPRWDQDGAKMEPPWAQIGQDGPTEVAKTGQDGAKRVKMRPRREKMSPKNVAIAGRFAVFAKLEQFRGKEGPRVYL